MTCVRVGLLKLYIEYSASPDETEEYRHEDLKFDVGWITTVSDELAPSDVEPFFLLTSTNLHMQHRFL